MADQEQHVLLKRISNSRTQLTGHNWYDEMLKKYKYKKKKYFLTMIRIIYLDRVNLK